MGVDGEVVEPDQPREAVAGQAGQLTMGNAQVLELGQVLKTMVIQAGPVLNKLGTLNGQGHCASPGYHTKVGLVIL